MSHIMKNSNGMIKKFSIYLIILSILILPFFAYSAGTTPLVGGKIPNPLASNNSSLMSLITDVLNKIVMPIAAVFVTIWIIYAGFKYVIAQGKPAEIEKAHKTLLWSLIGAGILLGAAAISKVVETTITALTR